MWDEWIYARPFTNGNHHHRSHTALAGQRPISRVNNGLGPTADAGALDTNET